MNNARHNKWIRHRKRHGKLKIPICPNVSRRQERRLRRSETMWRESAGSALRRVLELLCGPPVDIVLIDEKDDNYA